MRIDDVEQRLREAGELGVELELHARGEKGDALEEPLDVGIGDLEAVHAEPGRDLGKLLRELRAHFAEVLQLDVVVLEQPRIHHALRDRKQVRDLHLPRLEIDFGPHQQLQGNRLRPELAANLDADHVVVVDRSRLEERRDLQRFADNPRLVVENRLADGALQRGDVHRRGRPPGQRAAVRS